MAENFFVLVVRTQLSAVVGGPHSGTGYSMETACPRCGTGADQVGPLKLARFRPPPAELFLTLDDEVLVQHALADRLRAQNPASLTEVVDARSGDPLGVFQIRPEATLPPFAPATRGVTRERPCPVCRRDGHYGMPHEPYRLCYGVVGDALTSKDVLATYERFGTSVLRKPFADSVFAVPLLVVSERIVAALKHLPKRQVELQPVQVQPTSS